MKCREDRDGSDLPRSRCLTNQPRPDTPRPGPTITRCASQATFPQLILGVAATPDGDEEWGAVQRPQRSEDERPCAVTSAVHTDSIPGSDTPTASWT